MKKDLFMIELEYTVKCTRDQMEMLKKYTPVTLKTEDEMNEYSDEYKNMAKEEQKKFRERKLEEYMDAFNEGRAVEVNSPERRFPVDLNLFANDCSFVRFTVTGKTQVSVSVNIEDLNEVIEKFEELVNKIPETTFDTKADVHIGRSLLMTVNDLLLLEDCGTDIVQENLNNGWRIISCCVQPDGRRPDYIMGRYNPVKDIGKDGTMARREKDLR